MAIKDYNSSNFKNAAMDRLSGRFGKGPGDGDKKKSTSTTSATLPNPWSKPGLEPTKPTSIKKPATTPMPAAKPSTTVSTTADNATAAAPKKTMKEVKSENRIKKAEARGNAAVSNITKRAEMTPEQKIERREKRASNFGKAVKGAAELIGLSAATYTAAYQAGKKKGE